MSGTQRRLAAALAALADGSLPARRRTRLLEHVEASPELAAELARQREALALMAGLDAVSAPEPLRRALEQQVERAEAGPRRHVRANIGWQVAAGWRLVAASALAAAAIALAVALLTGPGTKPPRMQQVAGLALAPAALPAPPASASNDRVLADAVEGVWFPSWRQALAWEPVGSRVARLGGRTVRVVFYRPANGFGHALPRIGYAIVSGSALELPAGKAVESHGIGFHVFELRNSTLVAWRRAGHTCVLAGRGVSAATLIHLAAWA